MVENLRKKEQKAKGNNFLPATPAITALWEIQSAIHIHTHTHKSHSYQQNNFVIISDFDNLFSRRRYPECFHHR